MPMPVQKNYTIYIYIYIQYINLFPLNPSSTPLPNNLKVVSSRSKNLTLKERINRFLPFPAPAVVLDNWCLQMKPETKHTH